VHNQFKQLPPEKNMMRIQISSLQNQHQRNGRDFISYIVDAKGAIRTGFLGQDGAINADYY
jgi:hypothetical protein